MDMVSAVSGTATDAFERLVDSLRVEFGCSDVEGLAERFLEAEEVDFLWEARVAERHLGEYVSLEGADYELDRVAIISFLRGRWQVAICLVDGDGAATDLFERAAFGSRADAETALREAC